MIPSGLIALLLSLPVPYRAPVEIGLLPTACHNWVCSTDLTYGDVSPIWHMCMSPNLEPVLTANGEVVCK